MSARHLRTLAVLAALSASAVGAPADIDRAIAFAKQVEGKVFRSKVEPHWLPDGQRFWYRVQTGPKTWEYVLVEAETGKITRAADAATLSLPKQALTSSSGTAVEIRPTQRTGDETQVAFTNGTTGPIELFWVDQRGQRKSYGKIAPAGTRTMHTYDGHVWLVADATGDPLAVIEAKAEALELTIDGKGRLEKPRKTQPKDTSPDGRWQVRFEKHQAALRDTTTGETAMLTTDGTAAQPYRGPLAWSPDGQSFVVLSVKDAPVRKVTVIESSPADQTQPKTHTFDYAKPGDELPRPRPVLFRLADRQPVRIADELFPNPFTPGGALDIRWSPRSVEFFFNYNQRGHQLWRILAVHAQTGAVRTVVEEKARTFIDYTNKTWRHWLEQTGELLWMSERDGWCHLWLYDAATGAVKKQITRGAWIVRKVERVEEAQRQVWFLASGLRAGEDPGQRHLCRVNFDGSGFVQLTAGDGDHAIAFSPDHRYFTDTWSRADHPPVTELRRSDDGQLICELERADASALLATGWTMPERFVAKGRDGKTDIHGVLIKPWHFDPAKKYPVLEEVYAGPHGAFSPKTFGTLARQHAYAELGFIVVKADGMGTNHRGKAFQDIAWKNLQDAGFPDRIAWIKAAAATRPWMNLARVGIYGGSAGGQNAMRALLDHGDFYHAAFADCGCHDNRMDKIWWNEQWLGWPVDDSYVKASNVTDAAKLRGALMLCVGELDRNVDPASTMQVVHALQKAGKPFDLLVVAGAGHGAAETPYANRRRMEFFARQLLPVPDQAEAGARPRLQIINGSSETIDVSWLKTDAAREPNGSVAPGKDTIITTTLGHRFAVVGRDTKTEATLTSEVPVQSFRFGGVPAFYTQSISAHGFPIVASAKVNPYALKEAAFLVDLMLAQRPDVRAAMTRSGARMCLLAWNEFTTDLPEFARLSPKDYWDARARGTGGSETDPYCTSAEENVLGYPGDPYATECILIHEFAHCIHLRGMVNVDPTFDTRLKAAYDAAMQAGLWKGKYPSVNHHEYFAEGVQSWFDNNRLNDHDHNHVNTRALLSEYDPGLAAMCREVFGDTELKYTRPATRLTGHLAGYDPAKAPTFVWPERLKQTRDEIRAKAQARDQAANGDGKRETRTISGWTVHISRALLATNGPATARALELIEAQFKEIIRAAPAKAVAELQKVPLYLSPEYPGVRPRAEYHPDADWLRENGRDPIMEKAVEITSVLDFDASVRRMPMVILHELAHAYHDLVLPQGFGNPDIKAAYEKAKAGGKYDRVERQDSEGRKRMDRAYALTNPQEYFAENTEAFFGRNDFFPYTQDQLKQHDPEMLALLAKLFGVQSPP